MARDKTVLSEKELFEKTADMIEFAMDAKIEIQYGKGENWVRLEKDKEETITKKFLINIATPAVKGIGQYTALLHELAHILYESPFTPIQKLLKEWGHADFYFDIYNVLEDARIESHLTQNYIAYKKRFEKTLRDLGKKIDESIDLEKPANTLLAIRFMREDLVKDVKHYQVFRKAIEDVKRTDKFGALRVLLSIKKYLDEYIKDKSGDEPNSQENEEWKNEEWNRTKVFPELAEQYDAIDELRKVGNTREWCKKFEEVIEVEKEIVKLEPWRSQNYKKTVEVKPFKEEQKPLSIDNAEKSKSEECLIPLELTKTDLSDAQIDALLEDGKIKGAREFQQVCEKLHRGGTLNIPKNIRMLQREKQKSTINQKIVKDLTKFFKRLKMQKKTIICDTGYDIDLEEYIKNFVKGTELNKIFSEDVKDVGVSMVLSIDASSSMRQYGRIDIARELTATIFESVKGVSKIEMRGNVWGGNEYGIAGITEIKNQKDTEMVTVDDEYRTTPTHSALEYSGRMLKEMKGSKKLLIVITDGYPNGFSKGKKIQTDHYEKVCKKSLQKTLRITPHVVIIQVTQKHQIAYGMDWLEEKCERIFGAKRVIFVGGMESAAEQSIKLFKNFLKKNSKELF